MSGLFAKEEPSDTLQALLHHTYRIPTELRLVVAQYLHKIQVFDNNTIAEAIQIRLRDRKKAESTYGAIHARDTSAVKDVGLLFGFALYV